MNQKMSQKKQNIRRARKGFSLVELLIAVIVLGILSTMIFAAGTASQSKARMAVAQNDLDSIKNSLYQALMTHPNVMKFTDSASNISTVIEYFNAELDDAWRLKPAGTYSSSGLVAITATQKDPWGSPYGVYIFTNTLHKTYTDETGQPLTDSDSVMYVVVASAGRNGTGCALGVNGTNISTDTIEVVDTKQAVCNSDGIDDLGVIIRIKNGTLSMASFGTDQSTLGTLKDVQWIFGLPQGDGGTLYDFNKKSTPTSVSYAGSIDECYDARSAANKAKGNGGVIGTWVVNGISNAGDT